MLLDSLLSASREAAVVAKERLEEKIPLEHHIPAPLYRTLNYMDRTQALVFLEVRSGLEAAHSH